MENTVHTEPELSKHDESAPEANIPGQTPEAEAAKAALAPDKEKIASYAKALKAIEMPIGSTAAGKKACAEIGVIVDRALAEIRTIYTALK